MCGGSLRLEELRAGVALDLHLAPLHHVPAQARIVDRPVDDLLPKRDHRLRFGLLHLSHEVSEVSVPRRKIRRSLPSLNAAPVLPPHLQPLSQRLLRYACGCRAHREDRAHLAGADSEGSCLGVEAARVHDAVPGAVFTG